MIFFLIAVAACAGYIGYRIGFDKGKVALETQILHEVVNSPDYDHLMVETVGKAFDKQRKKS